MQLFCKDPNGTGATLTLELPAESSSATTIAVVKAQIQAQVPGLCACRLRLMYGQHTELADTRTLADYGIQEWSTLDTSVSRGTLAPCGPACASNTGAAGTAGAAGAGAAGTAGAAGAATPMLPVLFQDEHFIAVSKPSGLLVHPTPEAKGVSDTVLRRLETQLGLPKLWPCVSFHPGCAPLNVTA